MSTHEGSGGVGRPQGRRVTYCLIPQELAEKLHEPLSAHFRDDPGVEVVVERRATERRRRPDRRLPKRPKWKGEERREVLDPAGRRVDERRAPQVAAAPPELPRRARRYADALSFVERIEPSTQREEDADTARLVARFQAGDREAYGTLYKRYFSRVFGYMRSAFRDTHEAEDATQEVFTLVLKNLKRYERRKQPFRAWMFTIARNHAIRELRRLGRVEPMDPDEARMQRDLAVTDETEVTALDWIADRDLNIFVERLPLPQRQVLVLGFLLDLPDDQVARVMGRSQVDVRTLRHRALRFLEARLRAIGRVPQGETSREPWTRRTKKAPVLRNRRHALDP